ncbi:MAG TPA: hypothetical protein VMT39_02255 [Candidatus Bathyarchaeia archaeon]|nr:hypothetical protein [Candidatus Bathyarchaeia archaeon]
MCQHEGAATRPGSLSDERMSTRGLKPPPKDADKDKNKSGPKSDATNPK